MATRQGAKGRVAEDNPPPATYQGAKRRVAEDNPPPATYQGAPQVGRALTTEFEVGIRSLLLDPRIVDCVESIFGRHHGILHSESKQFLRHHAHAHAVAVADGVFVFVNAFFDPD